MYTACVEEKNAGSCALLVVPLSVPGSCQAADYAKSGKDELAGGSHGYANVASELDDDSSGVSTTVVSMWREAANGGLQICAGTREERDLQTQG